MKKQCFKCGEVKLLACFYRHPKMSDGHVNKCKECNKKDVRENRASKSEYYREYDKRRFQEDPRVKARHKRYQATKQGKEKLLLSKKKWESKNLIKKAASTMVGNAVRDGKIVKPDACSECGCKPSRIHGHHDDYAKPLEVRWLCPKCHMAWHKINGEGINAH